QLHCQACVQITNTCSKLLGVSLLTNGLWSYTIPELDHVLVVEVSLIRCYRHSKRFSNAQHFEITFAALVERHLMLCIFTKKSSARALTASQTVYNEIVLPRNISNTHLPI